MPITTVTTSQAPDAKPVAKNLVLSTTSAEIINVPNYRVPELVFGGSTTVEPGVGEIISPLVLCNVTNATVNVGVQYLDITKVEQVLTLISLSNYQSQHMIQSQFH